MKSKRFNKKLALNKKTVVDLDRRKMKEVNGGGICSWGRITCSTCEETACSGKCC